MCCKKRLTCACLADAFMVITGSEGATALSCCAPSPAAHEASNRRADSLFRPHTVGATVGASCCPCMCLGLREASTIFLRGTFCLLACRLCSCINCIRDSCQEYHHAHVLCMNVLPVPSGAASLIAASAARLLCISRAAFAALSFFSCCCFARCAALPLPRFRAVHSSPEDCASSGTSSESSDDGGPPTHQCILLDVRCAGKHFGDLSDYTFQLFRAHAWRPLRLHNPGKLGTCLGST